MEPSVPAGLDTFRRSLQIRPGSLFGPFAPGCVYHYTTATGFIGILNDEAIRATNFSFLNDSSEVQFGRTLIEARLTERKLTTDALGKRFVDAVVQNFTIEAVAEVYVACFSGLEDDLGQWRAYGNSPAERFAIGFDAETLQGLAAAEGNAAYAQVLYEQRDQAERVDYLIDKALRLFAAEPSAPAAIGEYAAVVAQQLARILPLLKDHAYRFETEWRLILWRHRGDHAPQFDASTGILRPYVLMKLGTPVPIIDLYVLAPNRIERTCKAADMRLETAKITTVKSRPSKIPFAD